MGKGSKCSTVGYRYFAGLHLVFCHAVDEVQEIVVGEKVAWGQAAPPSDGIWGWVYDPVTEESVWTKLDNDTWPGPVSVNSSINIHQSQLFGGTDREGGIVGQVDFEFGLPTQGRNPYLQGLLGNQVPAYRGLFALVARKMELGTNPYLKPWAARLKRVSTGWQPLLQEVNGGMNAAHIIRECLTNTTYGGLGYPVSDLDEQSFLTAAATLESEGFGLNLLWTKNSSIEDFIKYVLDHIDGVCFFSHLTGLFTMKLIRNDYDIGSLPVLNEANVLELEEYQGPTVTEGVNQVTVTYVDTQGAAAAVTVQDLGGIERMNGQINGATYDFSGINNAELATLVASRELAQACVPLATCTLKCNRTVSHLQPGDAFNFTWGPLGVESMAMRVSEVEIGLHAEGAIRIRAARDVFTLGQVSLAQPSASQWSSPINPPANSPYRRLEELLWWDFVKEFGTSASVLAELTDQTSLVTAFCTRPSSDAINFEMWARAQGAPEFTRRDTDSFPEALTTLTAMVPEVTSEVELSAMPDYYLVKVGDYAYLETELVAVTMIDGPLVTLTRGILDTIPIAHSAGATIIFSSALYGLDSEERAAGETVEVRLLPSTSEGRLALSSGTTNSLLCTGRMMRPYPPGNVKVNTLRWPASVPKATAAVTFQDTGDTATLAGHGFVNGAVVSFDSIVTTTGIEINTDYYVVGAATDTFQVSDTLGGAAKPLTNNGTGVVRFTPPLTVSWSHRSRILQTVSFNKQDEGDIGPEASVTYTLRIYGEGGTLLRTVTDLTGTSYTYTEALEKADSGFSPARFNTSLRIELEAVRDSLVSREKWNLTVARA